MQDSLGEPDEPLPDRNDAESPKDDTDAEERSSDRRVHKIDNSFACHRFSPYPFRRVAAGTVPAAVCV